jgi:hypothetical protein
MTETTLKAYCKANNCSRSGMDYHIRKTGIFPIGSMRLSEAGAPTFLWNVKDLDEVKSLIRRK